MARATELDCRLELNAPEGVDRAQLDGLALDVAEAVEHGAPDAIGTIVSADFRRRVIALTFQIDAGSLPELNRKVAAISEVIATIIPIDDIEQFQAAKPAPTHAIA